MLKPKPEHNMELLFYFLANMQFFQLIIPQKTDPDQNTS